MEWREEKLTTAAYAAFFNLDDLDGHVKKYQRLRRKAIKEGGSEEIFREMLAVIQAMHTVTERIRNAMVDISSED